MRRLSLSPDAIADIDRIGRYSKRQWGAEQSRRYGQQLTARLIGLKTPTRNGRRRLDVDQQVRCVKSGRHLIFFDIHGDRVVVLCILHEAMLATERIAAARAKLAKDE